MHQTNSKLMKATMHGNCSSASEVYYSVTHNFTQFFYNPADFSFCCIGDGKCNSRSSSTFGEFFTSITVYTILLAGKDMPRSYKSKEELQEIRGVLSALRAARDKEKEAFLRHQKSLQSLQVIA